LLVGGIAAAVVPHLLTEDETRRGPIADRAVV